MTKQDFIMVYKEMIKVELSKSDCKEKDQQYHEIRCYAFWLADSMRDYDRKDMAETILCGGFPVLQDGADLIDNLEELCDDYDDHTEVIQDLRDHITEYFGN